MSHFDFEDLDDINAMDRRPAVVDKGLAADIVKAIDEDALDQVRVRVGSVWSRKGYPESGSLSAMVSSSSYRGYDDQVHITVELLLDRWGIGPGLGVAINNVQAEQENEYRLALDAARQEKLDRAQRLREEAEKLEAEAL